MKTLHELRAEQASLQLAKGVINDAAKTYPGIRQWLADTGPDNSSEFIKQVIAFADSR